MTGRDNNVETDPALQGISEIGAATLRKEEIRNKILEKSTAMIEDLKMMRKACWQGMGRPLAPPPSSIVDRRNNLNPTEYNKQWREWVISFAKDYFDQNDPPSVEHINNDWAMACEMLVAARGIIGPFAGWDLQLEQVHWLCNDETHHVSSNAIVKVDDLDIYTVSDSTHNMTGTGKSGKKRDIKEELKQYVTDGSCEYSGATADMLIDRIIEAGNLMTNKKRRKTTSGRHRAPCHMEPQRSFPKSPRNLFLVATMTS
jgi:hypothetical protein